MVLNRRPARAVSCRITCPSVPNASSRTSPKTPRFVVRSMSPASFHSGRSSTDPPARAWRSSCNSSPRPVSNVRSGEVPNRQADPAERGNGHHPHVEIDAGAGMAEEIDVVEQLLAIVAGHVCGGGGASDHFHGRPHGNLVDDGLHQRATNLMGHQGFEARVLRNAEGGANGRALQARVGQPERGHAERQDPAAPVSHPRVRRLAQIERCSRRAGG